MLTRYGEIFSWDDISEHDAFTPGFVAQEGYVRNIFDFTDVAAIAIPRPKLLLRGRKVRTNPGQARVVVAPQPEIHDLYSEYARKQFEIGNGTMTVVPTLSQALGLLAIDMAEFQPIRIGGLGQWWRRKP
jgi:hypothetical protein